MSDPEVEPENKTLNESNEEVDIYSDVLSDQDSLIAKLKEKVDKLGKEKELLLKSLSSVQKSYEELRKEYGELKEKFKVVSFNSSALFKTAQAEIKRKDRLINELRKEKDDLVFRKTSVSQTLQRSRKCAVLSPRKQRSPIKKPHVVKSNTSLESPRPTRVPLIESVNPRTSEGPSEELKSSKPLKIPSVENNSNGIDSCIQVVKESLETVELPLTVNNNYSAPEPSVTIKAKPTPPPFKGPSTAYSRRLYKRIHGVSPPKSDISVNKDKLPENTELKLKFTSEETEANKSECKVESITSKLQKDVQEIIKLGSPSKTSPPLTTKLSPEKQKQYTTPIKDETPKQTPSKPTAEKLIIQCDLRNTLKDGQPNSQNSVSINETIDNILKKQRAGLYSPHTNVANNIKEEEHKKESLDSNPTSKTAIRLLTNLNKRTTDKLTISPATFGKLVSYSMKSRPDVTPPSKEIIDKSPTETKSESRKRKLSDMLPPENKTSPQEGQRLQRLDTYPKTIRKTKFISSLFGESPMKSDVKNIQEIQPNPSESPIILRTPSPIEKEPHPSSPIFPDSPSLDSDNHEDLIIDTTACSQNTSPRVSESDQKNVDEIDENTAVKLNVGLKNKSESQVFSQDDEAKQSAMEVEHLAISDERKAFTIPNNINEDKNNSLTEKNNIDNQEEKESTFSLPQITVTCEKTISEEDISECPPTTNEQNKLCDSNNSNQPKAGDHLRNLHLENSHSSASLDKVSSPEKSNESQRLLPSNNTDTILKNSIKEETPVARFIPSPPQLTLVSAFKHSENSVFALAEDTLGFVSALTRMRDISPIRTPDKKSKLFNRSLSQTQQSEPECASGRESEVMRNNNFEFLKPLDQGLQNNSPLSVGLKKVNTSSSECCNLNNPSSVELAPSCSLTPLVKAGKEDKESQKDSGYKTSTTDSVQCVKDKSHISRNQDQQRDIEQVLDTFKTIKSCDNGNVSNSKKTQCPTHYPFRRTKPVRRITIENKVKYELSTTYNIQPITIQAKHKDPSKPKEISRKDNLKHMDISDNTDKCVKEMDTHNIEVGKLTNKQLVELNSGKVLEELTNLEQDKNLTVSPVKLIGERVAGPTLIGGDKMSKGANECPATSIALPSLVSTNSDIIKTFKRSESLKMVQKPLPRNYLNIMKNIEAKKSEDVFEMSVKKTHSFEEFAPKESKLCNKSDVIKDKNKNSELNQISHIANINKKLRISKHQSKPEKENFNQLKLSETVVNNDKSSNDLSDEKITSQTSLIKNNKIVLSGKVRENKTKPHSTSFNAYQGKRRNDRRSVSLGPEIRLGIQINLPPIKKNKQHITASNYCSKDPNNIEPVEIGGTRKMGESIFSKNSPKDISEMPLRKSDDNSRKESVNKLSIFQKDSRIMTSSNLNPERKIHSKSKRSSSPSLRMHKIHQKCHTKSKSPDVEKTNPRGLKRSLSPSPDSKRSRINHKVSLRKSPDYERRHHHNLSRSCSRSPDHSRRKHNRTYSPRRTVSGGRSRRSRYDDYHRRSPSPDHRRHEYHEKEHRNRSSHYKYKYRSDRSRDRSSDPKHRKIEGRSRHESRNCSRRSRSSSSDCHDRSSRNCSPPRQKSDSQLSKNVNQFGGKYPSDENTSLLKDGDGKLDKHSEENTDDNTVLSYKEELDKIKKEIEMLKGQVKKHGEITPADSSVKSANNSEDHGLQHSSENVPCTELSANNTVEVVNTNMSIKNDKNGSNIRMMTEESEVSQTNSAMSLHNPCSTPGQGTSTEITQSASKSSTESKTPSIDTTGPRTPSTNTTGPRTPSTDTTGPRTPSTDTTGPRTPPTDTTVPRTPSTDTTGPRTPSTDTTGPRTPSTDPKGPRTPSTDTGPTLLSQEKPKPIQIKRRVRRLGDSEVQVVSIK